MGGEKLRILCFPGWRTSAKIMEDQFKMTGFSKTVDADLICVDPSFESEGPPPGDVKMFWPDGPYFQWWFMDETTKVYKRVEDTLERVADMLELQGPFDGILGFSQGGNLANIVSALQQAQDPRFEGQFRFVITIAGMERTRKKSPQMNPAK
eukprot:Platyproteum_vivax@DN6335_c0_g1_i1.p1